MNKPEPETARTCSFSDVIAYKRQHRPDMPWDAFRDWLHTFWNANRNTHVRLDETDDEQVLDMIKNEDQAACFIELRDEYGADLLWRLD